MKKENGSITLFTLISMIFLLTIAFTAYTSAMVKLQGQNEEIEQIKANYEQDISKEGLEKLYEEITATKKGATFSGNYTVTFNAGEGATVEIEKKRVIYSRAYGELPIPTKTGYKFEGWYTSADGGTKITAETTVNLTSNQTLYAHWTIRTYTITFNAGEGGIVSTKKKGVTYGKAYGELPTPEKTGHTFNGWYTKSTGGEEITADTTIEILNDHTLYAHWTANTYTVTLNTGLNRLPAGFQEVEYIESTGTQWIDTGTLNNYQNISIEYQRTNTGSNDGILLGSRSGFTQDFSVWTNYTKGTLAFHIYENSVVDTGWIYKSNPLDKHLLKIENGDIIINNEIKYSFKPTERNIGFNIYIFTLNQNNSADSRMFIGKIYDIIMYNNDLTEIWHGIPCQSKTAVTNADGIQCPSETIGLYDTVEGKFHTNRGKGTFIAGNNVSTNKEETVIYAQTYGELPTPEREGYSFNGWYTLEEEGEEVAGETIVTQAQDHTLYAHWTANTYIATFNPGENATVNQNNEEVTYGQAYGELPIPEKTGHTFEGWYTSAEGGKKVTAETIVDTTQDHTLYAHWTANSYTVTYDIESRLPSEYQEVGYIESTGTQYIDTGISGTFNDKIEFIGKFSLNSLNSNEQALIGSKKLSTNQGLTLFFKNQTRLLSSWCGSGTGYEISDVEISKINNLDAVFYKNKGRSISLNGQEYYNENILNNVTENTENFRIV